MAKNLALVIASIAVCLLLAEVILNALPVRDSAMLQPVTPTERVPHFKPNRDITWSNNWNFSIVNRRHINNFGFSDDQDYDPEGKEPILAVIGDSYVESFMVPYDASIQGRLAAYGAGRARVYSFGSSGAPLSTYLVYAEYVRDVFHAKGVVVVIIGNDFDQSLLEYKRSARLTHFRENDDGSLVLETIPYDTSPVRQLLRKSALVRYIIYNMKLRGVAEMGINFLSADENAVYVANTLAEANPERLQASRRAVDAFLTQLPEAAGLTSEQILFVVDGIRRQIYGDISYETAATSFVHKMRRYFIAAARARSYEVIDMHPVFEEHFRRHGKHFEFPTDDHWNALGHSVAAAEVRRSRVFSALTGPAEAMVKPIHPALPR